MIVKFNDGMAVQVWWMIKPRRRTNPETRCRVRMTFASGGIVGATGKAKCCRRDRYNKAVGKARALDRALSALGRSYFFSREQRLKIWARFYETFRFMPGIKVLGMPCRVAGESVTGSPSADARLDGAPVDLPGEGGLSCES